jgi:carbonic anhydrase
MSSVTIEEIRKFQEMLENFPEAELAEHCPEMLLIGCVDARLNPAADIGIPYGKALIKRNIAALVPEFSECSKEVSAVLSFAIERIGVKEIVVMGHTHCGGIAACVDGIDDSDIGIYLAPLKDKRDSVKAAGGTLEEQARSMEKEAVQQSLVNLMTYPVVKKAMELGEIKLHGWVIDTRTRKLSVLNQKTNEFVPMV